MLSAAEFSIGRRAAGGTRTGVRRALWEERTLVKTFGPRGTIHLAGNYPVLLVDGTVGGVWHQRRAGPMLAITVEPLRELTARQRRQLRDEADVVDAVMESAVTLTVGTVTAGPHA